MHVKVKINQKRVMDDVGLVQQQENFGPPRLLD